VQSKVDEGTTVTVALPQTLQLQSAQPASNITTLAPPSRLATPEQAAQVKKSA
jgi:cell cycle sensor histidine kinase DivJ